MQNLLPSLNQVQQLIELLGEKNGIINEPQIDINTDRDDKSLISNISDFYNTISKVSNILECAIDDLTTQRNYDESDHEVVAHNVVLNPFGYYQTGFIHKLDGELHTVDNYDYDTSGVTLTNLRTSEQKTVNRFKLENVNWYNIYPELLD